VEKQPFQVDLLNVMSRNNSNRVESGIILHGEILEILTQNGVTRECSSLKIWCTFGKLWYL